MQARRGFGSGQHCGAARFVTTRKQNPGQEHLARNDSARRFQPLRQLDRESRILLRTIQLVPFVMNTS
jgi:hypothetical protein